MNHWNLFQDRPGFQQATTELDAAWEKAKLMTTPAQAEAHVLAVLEQWRGHGLGATNSDVLLTVRNRVREHFGTHVAAYPFEIR